GTRRRRKAAACEGLIACGRSFRAAGNSIGTHGRSRNPIGIGVWTYGGVEVADGSGAISTSHRVGTRGVSERGRGAESKVYARRRISVGRRRGNDVDALRDAGSQRKNADGRLQAASGGRGLIIWTRSLGGEAMLTHDGTRELNATTTYS